MNNHVCTADKREFYHGVTYGNELSKSTWVGFLAATLLHRG